MSNIEDFTKEEIILTIKKVWKCEEKLMMELPITRYNTMCEKAKAIGEKASIALERNRLKEAMLLFDESNALYEKAKKFMDCNLEA